MPAVAEAPAPGFVLAGFAEEYGITYPLLSDNDSAVIEAFGILNTVAEEGFGPNADDPDVHEVRAAIYLMRRKHESSLMSKGRNQWYMRSDHTDCKEECPVL